MLESDLTSSTPRRRHAVACLWVLFGWIGSAGAQTPAPPSTSGNLTTIILGLMAFSLIVVLLGAWAAQGIRSLWKRPPARHLDQPGGDDKSSIYCTECGEPMLAGDRFCHICGEKVEELAR